MIFLGLSASRTEAGFMIWSESGPNVHPNSGTWCPVVALLQGFSPPFAFFLLRNQRVGVLEELSAHFGAQTSPAVEARQPAPVGSDEARHPFAVVLEDHPLRRAAHVCHPSGIFTCRIGISWRGVGIRTQIEPAAVVLVADEGADEGDEQSWSLGNICRPSNPPCLPQRGTERTKTARSALKRSGTS